MVSVIKGSKKCKNCKKQCISFKTNAGFCQLCIARKLDKLLNRTRTAVKLH